MVPRTNNSSWSRARSLGAALIADFRAVFPDAKVTIHEIISAPGRAAVRALISGTHEGEWFGIAPTDKSCQLAIHEFHHIANGRLTHTWHLEDWFGWLNQLGVWPASLNPLDVKLQRGYMEQFFPLTSGALALLPVLRPFKLRWQCD